MIAHRPRGVIDVPELFRLWQSDMTTKEIAAHFGVSPGAVSVKASTLQLGRRPVRAELNDGPGPDDPSPEEIEKISEELRREWSRKVERSRAGRSRVSILTTRRLS